MACLVTNAAAIALTLRKETNAAAPDCLALPNENSGTLHTADAVRRLERTAPSALSHSCSTDSYETMRHLSDLKTAGFPQSSHLAKRTPAGVV